MKIDITLDMQSIISGAVSTDRLRPIVDKAISEAIKSAIDDATGYRSEFRVAIKKQLEQAMPHGLGVDDVARFQYVLNTALTEGVHGANNETIQTALRKAAHAAIPDVPARITLTDLMEEARSGLHKEDHEAFYANLEISSYGGGWLALDSDENCRNKYAASIRISFNKEGEVYALKMDGKDIMPKSTPNVVGGFDALLMGMYVGRTALAIDLDDDDVETAAQSKCY